MSESLDELVIKMLDNDFQLADEMKKNRNYIGLHHALERIRVDMSQYRHRLSDEIYDSYYSRSVDLIQFWLNGWYKLHKQKDWRDDYDIKCLIKK